MFKSDQAVQLKDIRGGRGFTKRENQSNTHKTLTKKKQCKARARDALKDLK